MSNGEAPQETTEEQQAEPVVDREPVVPSKLPVPGSFLGLDDDTDLDEVGELFRRGALAGLLLWCVLVFVVMRYSPAHTFDEPKGVEQNVHFITFLLLLVTNGTRIIPLAFHRSGMKFFNSGIAAGAIVVQVIAMASNLMMCLIPTPVVVDLVSGHRFHLIRWAEWTPLAFLMAFLTSNIDAPLRNGKVTFTVPIMMALSTFCGMIFPFCNTIFTWMANMAVSWTLFLSIYVLTYHSGVRYRAKKDEKDWGTATASEQESFLMIRFKYMLCVSCSVTWTVLAAVFTVLWTGPAFSLPGSVLREPSLPVILTGMFDVFSKVWYLTALINAYRTIFDEQTRAMRKLEEVRSFLSAVWSSSSDAIMFCGEQSGRITARISPSFSKMAGLDSFSNTRGTVSLGLEIFPEEGRFCVFEIDLSRPVTREDASKLKQSLRTYRYSSRESPDGTQDGTQEENHSIEERNLQTMALLAVKVSASTTTESELSYMEDLLSQDDSGVITQLRCEMKIAPLEGSARVLVIRNISDRVQRFEAEKKLVREMTIRRKNAEANRFTRHEVKNGILAAIGLVDHLRDIVERSSGRTSPSILDINGLLTPSTAEPSDLGNENGMLTSPSVPLATEVWASSELDDSLDELDVTLRDILDTILDEAMAREIIYGEYEPKKERMNLPDVLDSLRRRSTTRFPLKATPDPFPYLYFDRQLLRYVYRNAVSNACKYGKKNGVVAVDLKYDKEDGTVLLKVENEPGEGHEELVALDGEAVASVFEPGTQLSVRSIASGHDANVTRNESSGNGAWIMFKCAETMGGRCDILFEPERTVFTFCCPAEEGVIQHRSGLAVQDHDNFRLPTGTWGIAVDDSKIQRKLMDRFLKSIGIETSRRIILGQDAKEVTEFCDLVASLMKEHPDDKFILIADENLDIEDGGARHKTVSGSLCIERMRSSLDVSLEKRLLALVRSANDSTSDIELYKARAHGFLLKEPIRRNALADVVRPWWMSRFPNERDFEHADRCDISESESETYTPSSDDIRGALRVLDALCSVHDEEILHKRWRPIREKLHVLKGDLKTTQSKEALRSVLNRIDSVIFSHDAPPNFSQQWVSIHAEIESIL